MSLTMGIYKGSTYQDGEFLDDRPVSFFRVWKQVWSPAIAACGGRLFQDCSYFPVSQIPDVLAELDRIYDWVQINGGEDTEYVSWRIRDELKPFLIQFYQEHKDEDYWFDVG